MFMTRGGQGQGWRAVAALALVSLGMATCSRSPVAPTPPPPPPVDPPAISCPASQSLVSPFSTPIAVTYSTPTVVGGSAPVTTTCAPESGTTFPLGSTAVTCTATDSLQRRSSCTLTVTVEPRAPITLTRFAAFGDSITFGEDGTQSLRPTFGIVQHIRLFGSEYPSLLRTALQARYPLQAGTFVVNNNGLPGEYAGGSDTVARFSREVLGAGVQGVLLMEGSNDTNAGIKDSLVLPPALANLRAMVQLARRANLRVYLATLPPMRPCSSPGCRGIGQELVPSVNDTIRGLAQSEGVTLVDVYAAFGGDLSLLSADGLHPNAQGYQRIADAFFDKLVETLEQRSTLR
jgi:lysophospholipase L1-like esterase